MLVEFVGAPGTGKTTLASAAIQFLREQGSRVLAVEDLVSVCAARTQWGRIMTAVVPHPWQGSVLWRVYSWTRVYYRTQFAFKNYAFWQYIADLHRNRSIHEQDRRRIRRYLDGMMSLYQFYKVHMQPDEILIFDEGFAHRVTHFVSDVEEPNPSVVMRYVELMPPSDLVILVRAPVETCVDRVWSRGLRGRLRDKSKREVNLFIANSAQAVDIAAHYIEHMGRNVLQVENNGSLDTCVASLTDQLEVFLFRNTRAY